MATKQVLGIFRDADAAAAAMDRLKEAGFKADDVKIMTGHPYPEGAFGEKIPKHRLYAFPFVGAVAGFTIAVLLTAGTQVSYPLVTGGKPILAVPAMAVITYEGTMLGAILMTIFGVLFESRLPRPIMGLYDTRITEGYIGVELTSPEERLQAARLAFSQSGAVDVKNN